MTTRSIHFGTTDGTRVGVGGDGTVSTTTLTVTLTDATDPVINVVNVDYSMVVTNTGSVDATSVSAVVNLDASLTFVSGSGTGWSVVQVGQQVTCTRATLAVGAAPTVTITVTTADAASTATSTADASASNAPAATQATQATTVKLVDRDATSGKRYPSSLTQWQDFNAYNVAIGTANFPNVVPASLWLMQEASGNLADSIGSVTMTQTGAGHQYQQAVTGHTRKAVATVDGTVGQKWLNNTTATNPNTHDTLVLMVLGTPVASPVAQRDIMAKAAADDLRINTNGKLRAVFGAAADLVNDCRNRVMPVMVKVDNTNTASQIYTDQEKFTGTYAAPASAALLAFGAQTANAATMLYTYAAEFDDANARVSDAGAKSLLQALGWTIPWT